MSIVASPYFEAWWTEYGTMGVRVDIKLGASSPAIDLTTVNAQRIRLWDASLAPFLDVVAVIIGTPTASTISLRYIPASGALPPASYWVAGLVSLDAGATYYPTLRASLVVAAPTL